MFRILRTFPVRRPFLRCSRPSRTYPTPYHRSLYLRNGPILVRRVELKGSNRLRARILDSVIRPVAWLALTYFIYDTVVGVEEELESSSAIGEGEDDSPIRTAGGEENAQEEDDTVFIPLGLAYELPKTFYKGSDPEWQSFVRLARDREKCDALKNELTGIIGEYVGALPQMEKLLGKGNQPQKYWLDIDYPSGPPPEYERKGLEIGDDHISWTTRSVHPLQYTKLQNALWPGPLASSVWASCKIMASLQYAKVKGHFKFSTEPKSSDSNDSTALSLQNMQQEMSTSKHEPDSTSKSVQPAEGSGAAEAVDQPQTDQAPSDSGKPFQLTFPPPGTSNDLATAATAFKATFSERWQPVSIPPERGTVFFSGMVELVGPKGVAVLDVRGAYHAADSRWTQVSMAVRRAAPRKQGPRGGR